MISDISKLTNKTNADWFRCGVWRPFYDYYDILGLRNFENEHLNSFKNVVVEKRNVDDRTVNKATGNIPGL